MHGKENMKVQRKRKHKRKNTDESCMRKTTHFFIMKVL